MRRNNYLLLCFVLAFVAVIGCEKVIENELDLQLTEALELVSPNNNTDFFKLPDSDDFENIPQDPNNPITREKVQLGKLLFHETGIALNPEYEMSEGTYSCASCHHAGGGFQAAVPQGISDGGIGYGINGEGRKKNPMYDDSKLDIQPIRTPSALNSAYQKVMLWNRQLGARGINEGTQANWTAGTPKENNHLGFEGVETQAIAGLTVHRLTIDTAFIFSTDYKSLFDYAFPDVAEQDRYNEITAGLAIAAYERTMLANEAPFQQWLRGDYDAMTDDQKEGAVLFFVRAGCGKCHTGPALNSDAFYALGMDDLSGPGVFGTIDEGTKKGRGGFTGNDDDMYKFKVPQLYSLAKSPFYGHGASFTSVKDVIDYKNAGIKENNNVPNHYLSPEFKPLNLTGEQVRLLTAFVEEALMDENLHRYEPSVLPSGNCFPNNDPLSKVELGCN